MTRHALFVGALAIGFGAGLPQPTSAAGLAISSKRTLYCELETPQGSSSCLFPVTVTKWPSWVPDSAKTGILELERLTSEISGIVSGVTAVQSAIKTAMSIAANLGLYTPGPSEQDLIYQDVLQILQIVRELQVLQHLTYDGLHLQNNEHYLDDSKAWAQDAMAPMATSTRSIPTTRPASPPEP